MLEIVAQILCTLLLLAGLNFISQALLRLPDIHPFALIVSLLAGAFSIGAAFYFYSVVDSQSSGARKAFDEIQQQLAPPVEPVDPLSQPSSP